MNKPEEQTPPPYVYVGGMRVELIGSINGVYASGDMFTPTDLAQVAWLIQHPDWRLATQTELAEKGE